MMRALDRLIRGFHSMHLSVAVVGVVVVVCALPATLGAQTTTVSLRDAVFIASGSELFAKNCAVGYCHGSEGRAGRGPRLRDKVWNADKLFGVVHDGMPNTTMPPWKDILPEREIWSIVAYVISIGAVDSDAAAGKVQLSASGSSDLLTDEARKGRELFFDLMNEKRCSLCHRAGSKGEAIGPHLATVRDEPASQIKRDIIEPQAAIAEGFEQVTIDTNRGERIVGLKQQETEEFVRLYDTASIPAPLRTIYKDEIKSRGSERRSAMPAGYRSVYSDEELSAIIAYLKSGRL
jgi:putative heme-binding domain-containing protein